MRPGKAEVEAVAAAYREAVEAENAAPRVVDINTRLAGVERAAGALARRLDGLGVLLGDGLDSLSLDLQDLQRRAGMALLSGRGPYRGDRLPPKTVLCVEALKLWRARHAAPATAYVDSPFYRLCADLYTEVTGDCAEARGVGLIGHVKAALRHGKLSGENSPASFLNTAVEAGTLPAG